jgi:polyadenylate-binding protein
LLCLQDDKGKSRGFGFVNFSSPEAANKAAEGLTGKEVNGKSLYAGRWVLRCAGCGQ